MKIRIVVLLSLLLVSKQSLAQVMDLVQMKSPQSYAFEKNGNVPVNLYTGAIDLKIPVANIGGSEVDISATLLYDSSGFLPHKKSDAAGVNWSLLAGGRITRKMNVIPDEYVGQPTGTGTANNPYYQSRHLHGFLTGVRANPSTNTAAYNITGTGTGHTDGTEWIMGPDSQGYEGEPDEFIFNVMGLSGKFMIGNDGNVLVESSDPNIKVDLSLMALYGGSGFCEPPVSIISITDGKGNKYIFGGDLSKYEISYSYSIEPDYPNDDYNGHPMISSFSLSKIILANKKEITFDYEQGTLANNSFCLLGNWINLRDNSKIFSMDSYTQDGGKTDSMPVCNGDCDNPDNIATIFNGPSKKTTFSLLKKSVLKSIKYQDDEIRINYLDTGYPIMHYTLSPFYANRSFNEWIISSIETYHKDIRISKQDFSYDHLGGTFKRPFLKSIENLESNQTYKFEYYKTDNLPAYYTKGIDHWGYWNGLDNNISLSPFETATSYGDYTLYNTFRDPNADKCDVALLKKITYPTKGSSVFEYEPHLYAKRIERIAANQFLPALLNNGGLAGGARIKKISSFNENGMTGSKEYEYTLDYQNSDSSGILMNWPRYYYFIQMLSSGLYRHLLIRASSNVQVNSLDSYNVGYSKVFEIENGKGYIEHKFTTYETHPDLMNTDPYNNTPSTAGLTNIVPFNLYVNLKNIYGIDKSILRGKPLSQKYFSQADLASPIKKIEYEYYDNMEYNPNNAKDDNNYVSINHSSGAWTQAYRRFMNPSPIKKITTTDYLSNTQVVTKSENLYDSPLHLNLSKTNVTSSDNSVTQTTYRYARGNTPLVNANMLSIPLEIETIKDSKTISRVETKYENISPAELFPSSVVSYDLQSTISSGYTDVVYDKYDNKGNLQQYTTKDGTSTTIIWGYNQTKPIAKITGAKLTDIQQTLIDAIVNASTTDNATAPNNDETALLNELNTFRKHNSLSTFQMTTYTYDPLVGIRSITPPNGIRENYLYDAANRLEKIIDSDGKILKEYTYNYSPATGSIFFNAAVSKRFRNLSCGSDSVGSPVTYSVPANQYSSNISQDDADYKAELDLNTNGQALANAHSICMSLNCPVIFNSALDISGTSNVNAINSEGRFELTLSFTTGSNSTTLPWDGDPGVKIGNINGSCRPSDTILGGTMQAGGNLTVWWSVRPNGDIYIDNTPAPADNSSQTWVLKIPFY